MKRTIALILSLLCLLTLAASCKKEEKKGGSASPAQNTANAAPAPVATEPVIDDLVGWDGPVIRAAFSTFPDGMNEKLKAFEESGEIRVQRMDYSVLNSDFDPYAGEERLILDIVTGKIAPDLVILPSATCTLATTVREKKLYADLTPYIDADDTLNRENLFGSVLTSFSTADGQIWGLSNGFTANTLIGNDALLGSYAGASGWTLEELLDYAESLPPNTVLIRNLSQDMAALILLGSDGYAQFIDRDAGTCSFDSPLFIRWLNFLASLPKDWNELTVKSPLESLPSAERYELYYNNKVALEHRDYFKLTWMMDDASVFGTDVFTRIGFPDAEESRMKLDFDWSYVILRNVENPDAAWDFMKTFFEPERIGIPPKLMFGEIPVLKTIYEELAEQYKDTIFITYFSGGGAGIAKGHPDNPKTDADLDKPGHMYEFTDADAERILAMLDSAQVTRIADSTPSEVQAIVEEEISAFLANHASAENCAAAIQSRVNLWLAERG